MAWIWAVLSMFLFVYVLLSPKSRKHSLPVQPGSLLLATTTRWGRILTMIYIVSKHGPIMGLRFGFVPTIVISSKACSEDDMPELMRHPPLMKKLHGKLEPVVGMDQMVEESHTEKLKYLDILVKEMLRLHPVSPLLFPHESMEDSEVDGFHIPKNSRIILNVWAIGRDPNVWPNSESFTPEVYSSGIGLTGRHIQLIPFGSGRRGCPGLQLGLTLAKLVVVHCFDWELPDGMLPIDLDMSEHFSLVTVRAKHLMVIPSYLLPM